jgi:hypothetical protein
MYTSIDNPEENRCLSKVRKLKMEAHWVMIGVLWGKLDKIETRWRGEFEVPRVLGVLAGLRGMSHAFWGSWPVSEGCEYVDQCAKAYTGP